jgi:hypothetical protein
MKYIFDKVKEFNEAFGIDIKAQSKELRYDLFKEEAGEYVNTFEDVDRADAIADMLYIWAGTVLKHEFEDCVDSLSELLNRLKGKDYKRIKRDTDVNLFYSLMHWNDKYLRDTNNEIDNLAALRSMLEVILECIVKNGFQLQILHIFDAVHKSNMAKLGPDGKPIINGQNGVLYPGKPLNKVMKPEGWKDPKEKIFKILSEN